MSHIDADVLCECFALLSFSDRVTATHVCRQWRHAALSYPGVLWSHILSSGARTGVIRQLLDRAQNVPVTVEILLTDETFEDAMAAISDHLFHIRQLLLSSLHLDTRLRLSMENIHLVYRALVRPAPILEELEMALYIDEGTFNDFGLGDADDVMFSPMVLNFDRRIPTDIFAGHAPCLRKAAFLTMQLHPDGVPALAGVARLKFTGLTLPAVQLWAIVSTLPNLKALRVETRYGYELPGTPAPVGFCLDELHLEMLQNLCDESVGPLLRYLKHHRVRDLTTYRLEGAGWLNSLVDPPRTRPHTVHFQPVSTSFCKWHMEDAGGYASRGLWFETKVVFAALLARNIFAGLQTIVLYVRLLSSDLPPLDGPDRLALYCFYSHELAPYVAAPLATPLRCPTLRVLEICEGAPGRDRVTLCAGDLQRFVANVLGTDSPAPRLVLRNVSFDASPAELPQDRSILGTVSTTEERLAIPVDVNYLQEQSSKWQVGSWSEARMRSMR